MTDDIRPRGESVDEDKIWSACPRPRCIALREIMKKRRSIRSFKFDPIPPACITLLEDALMCAPSAGNLQSRHFYFIYDEEIKKRISQTAAFGQHFISEAPLVIIGCADLDIVKVYGDRGVSLYSIQDVAASVQNLMLMAYNLGLGSVWVGAFWEAVVSEILDLPSNHRPIAIVPVGYRAVDPQPPLQRKNKESSITYVGRK